MGPETLRVAHPCAQSRSTVHPEHNSPGTNYPPQLRASTQQHFPTARAFSGLTQNERARGVPCLYQDRMKHGCFIRDPREGFTASPDKDRALAWRNRSHHKIKSNNSRLNRRYHQRWCSQKLLTRCIICFISKTVAGFLKKLVKCRLVT